MDLRPKGIPWDRHYWERIQRKGGAHYRAPCSDYIDVERKIEARELRYADRVEVHVAGQKFMETVVVLNGGVYMSTGIKGEHDGPANERVHSDGRTEQQRYDDVTVTGSGRQVEDEDPTDINPNRPRIVECVAWDHEAAGDNWREPSPNMADAERRIADDSLQDGDLVFIEDTMECVNVLLDRKYMIRPAIAHSNYPPSAAPDRLPPEPPPKRRIVEGVHSHGGTGEFVSYSGDRKVYPALSEADEELRASLGMTRAQWDEWNHGKGWSDPKPITGADLRTSALYFATRAEKHRREARWWAGATVACLLLMVGVLFIPTEWIYQLFEAFK